MDFVSVHPWGKNKIQFHISYKEIMMEDINPPQNDLQEVFLNHPAQAVVAKVPMAAGVTVDKDHQEVGDLVTQEFVPG